jgi:hypothetical protein
MARTQLTPQIPTDAGITLSFTAANVDGHWVLPGDLVYVKNGGASPINVTLPTPVTVDGKAVADTVIAVANASEKIIGDIDGDVYGVLSGADAGRVYVDFSAVTSVTVACIRP